MLWAVMTVYPKRLLGFSGVLGWGLPCGACVVGVSLLVMVCGVGANSRASTLPLVFVGGVVRPSRVGMSMAGFCRSYACMAIRGVARNEVLASLGVGSPYRHASMAPTGGGQAYRFLPCGSWMASWSTDLRCCLRAGSRVVSV